MAGQESLWQDRQSQPKWRRVELAYGVQGRPPRREIDKHKGKGNINTQGAIARLGHEGQGEEGGAELEEEAGIIAGAL